MTLNYIPDSMRLAIINYLFKLESIGYQKFNLQKRLNFQLFLLFEFIYLYMAFEKHVI